MFRTYNIILFYFSNLNFYLYVIAIFDPTCPWQARLFLSSKGSRLCSRWLALTALLTLTEGLQLFGGELDGSSHKGWGFYGNLMEFNGDIYSINIYIHIDYYMYNIIIYITNPHRYWIFGESKDGCWIGPLQDLPNICGWGHSSFVKGISGCPKVGDRGSMSSFRCTAPLVQFLWSFLFHRFTCELYSLVGFHM